MIPVVFNDGRNDYDEGRFINNPLGSAHIPQSKQGCTVLIAFPEGWSIIRAGKKVTVKAVVFLPLLSELFIWRDREMKLKFENKTIALLVPLVLGIQTVHAGCKGKNYRNHVSSLEFSPSKYICGKELKRFTVLLNSNASKILPSFNGVEIFIRNKSGSMVTRQKLRSLGLNHDDKLYACISDDYIDNTTLKFYYRVDKISSSYTNGTSTRTLKASTLTEQCDLKDLVRGL